MKTASQPSVQVMITVDDLDEMCRYYTNQVENGNAAKIRAKLPLDRDTFRRWIEAINPSPWDTLRQMMYGMIEEAEQRSGS